MDLACPHGEGDAAVDVRGGGNAGGSGAEALDLEEGGRGGGHCGGHALQCISTTAIVEKAQPELSPLSRRSSFHARNRSCTTPDGPTPSPPPSGCKVKVQDALRSSARAAQ